MKKVVLIRKTKARWIEENAAINPLSSNYKKELCEQYALVKIPCKANIVNMIRYIFEDGSEIKLVVS